jgi:hypothetical protein
VAQDEGDRELDEADAGVGGELGELAGCFELALVVGQVEVEPEDRVGRLLGDEAFAVAALGGPLGLDDGRGGEGRVAEVADLALVDQVGECAEGLVEVGLGSQRWIW